MGGLFFEDFHVGRQFATEPVTLSEDEIVAFAQKYDPQPIHVDPAVATTSVYGGLIASGFQTIAVAAGQWLRTGQQVGTGLGGPGLRDIRWLAPVRPGDVLLEAPCASKRGGVVTRRSAHRCRLGRA